MKRLHKLALSVVAVVAVVISFSGCADESKSPLMKLDSGVLRIYSRDDETIIKKMTIKGRNGKCDEDWGSVDIFSLIHFLNMEKNCLMRL